MSLGIRSWVTQDEHNSAIRSKYGKRDSQMSSRAKAPARAFSLAVDQQAVQQQTDAIANHKNKQSDLAGPHQALVREHEEARQQTLGLKDRIVRVALPQSAVLTVLRMASTENWSSCERKTKSTPKPRLISVRFSSCRCEVG